MYGLGFEPGIEKLLAWRALPPLVGHMQRKSGLVESVDFGYRVVKLKKQNET